MTFTGSDTIVVKWVYRKIFEACHDEWEKDLETLVKIIGMKLLNKGEDSFHIQEQSQVALKKVICNLKSKWRAVQRSKVRFLKDNKNWLDSSIDVTVNEYYLLTY